MHFSLPRTLFLFLFVIIVVPLNAQKRIIGDCTIHYAVHISDEDSAKSITAERMLYMKGRQLRIDFLSNDLKQSLYMLPNSNQYILTKVMGHNKYYTLMDSTEWYNYNARFQNAELTFPKEQKVILGYNCQKATVKMMNGSYFTLFYAVDLLPTVKENDFMCRDIPGIVMELMAFNVKENIKTHFIAKSVNLMPVFSSYFIPNTKGYRNLPLSDGR